jgi:hypothetical protein
MAWLCGLVNDLESDLKIRRRLRFTANPAMVIRSGRIFLAERAPTGQNDASAVSIRATSAASRALEMARHPTCYVDLCTELLATAAGATSDKVEKVLSELWKQTFLLSDLRPPLTADPAQYVLEKLGELADVPAASDAPCVACAASWRERKPLIGLLLTPPQC